MNSRPATSALADFLQYVAQTSDLPIAIEMDHAEGPWLYGPSGQRWLDMVSGVCVNNLGHSDPDIVAAICGQAGRYMHPMVYGEPVMAPQVLYARRLVEALGPPFAQVYFTNSGAEAIEGALKLAKRHTGRSALLAFENAYHGSTHGALSVSGTEWMKAGYGPMLPEVSFIPFNDTAALSAINHDTAAVVVEYIAGAAGVILPKPGYLEALRRRCDECGALLILDEIKTGMGRTGSLFAFQHYGVVPDIICLAKSLGGGLPLGAFAASAQLMDCLRRDPPLGYITTFGGGPVACAGGLVLLEKLMQPGLLEGISAREKLLHERLVHPAFRELRGKGLMYALVLDSQEACEKLRIAALERGLVLLGFLGCENALLIAPPLNIPMEDLAWGCTQLNEAASVLV